MNSEPVDVWAVGTKYRIKNNEMRESVYVGQIGKVYATSSTQVGLTMLSSKNEYAFDKESVELVED